MILVVCIILGFIVGFVAVCIDWYGYDSECWFGGLAGVLFGAVLGAFVLLCGNCVLAENLTETEVIETKPIYAMSDTMGVTGSFFLGTGSIDSDMKYVYAEETDRGIKVKTIDVDDAYVKYINEGEQPYIETVELSHKSGFATWLFGNPTDREYVFYVPEGTVKNVYNVDLE